MTAPGSDGHHERADAAIVGDDRSPVIEMLKLALNAEDTETTDYHLREALQLLHIESNTELARLANLALDAEEMDKKDRFIREVLEHRHIKNKIASVRRTNTDERAK